MMKRCFRFLCFFILLPAVMVLSGREKAAPPLEEVIKQYQTIIRETIAKQNIVGAGVALIMNGSTVYKESFGYADKRNKIPYTTRTNQPIGSITKPITVLGVMQLQEKGMLQIDRPLQDYLPEFSIHSRGADLRQITLRSLITHTSGLPNDVFLNATLESEKYTGILSYLPNETLAFPPGTIYHYSNIGYCLLGHAIYAVSKLDYPKYMQKYIFRAAGMSRTGFIEYDPLKDISRSYNGDGNLVKNPRIRTIPAGGAYSNVEDMTALAQELIAIYHGKKGGILKQETVMEIFREQKNSAKFAFKKNGLGWDLFTNASGFFAFHFGSDNINQACLMIHPERKSALVAMANSAGGRVLNDTISERFRSTCGFNELDFIVSHSENPRKTEALPLTSEMIQAHSGTYGHTTLVFDAIQNDGKLVLKYGDTKLELQPVSRDEFIPCKVDDTGKCQPLDTYRVIFKDIGDYHALFWETETRQREALGYKLEPQVIATAWKKCLGKYRIQGYQLDGPDTFSEAELSVFENRLLKLTIFYTSGTYQYNLRIENDHELVTCGFDPVTGGDTIRFRLEGDDIFMTIYGLTLKKRES